LFDRYEGGEQAVLVHVNFSDENAREDIEELGLLVSSAGVSTLSVVTTTRQSPDPKYYVGSGKAEEIAQTV
jgi:GTP-binding protein HflX